MVSRRDASLIAEMLLYRDARHATSDEDVPVIDDDNTIESDEWWVFVYNTSEYVRTGASQSSLLGNAPIMVNKATGDAKFGRTNISIDEQLHGPSPDQPPSPFRDISAVLEE